MRTTLKHTLAACIALSALMLTGTACTQDDDLQQPAGTGLLALGEVTIDGAQTATATRAPITQDDKGYTGIRKTKFVTGEELALVLNDGSTNTATITATLDANGTWTLPKTYFTAGTKLFATYTATSAAGMTYGDNLAAVGVTLPTDGTKLSLTLTHANAQVEITPPAGLTPAGGTGTGIAYSGLTVNITPTNAGGGATPSAQTLATAQEGTDAHLRHRTIAPANAKLNSVSLVVNGITYTAPIAGTPTLEANKRYPIALTITGDVLTATVGTALDWGAGTDFEGIPTGYDYYIRTVDDLVAFRDAVNGGASTVKALQMADIDLSGAGNWTPIGGSSGYFSGSYNGNGHTISNLTITQESSGTNTRLGLFRNISGAQIMGVHFRNCKIKSTGVANVWAGALAGYCRASTITLCSATGSIDINGDNVIVGGMIGKTDQKGNSDPTPGYITRCSADVAVTMTSTTSTAYAGGFTGLSTSTYYAGCIASGTVKRMNSGTIAGFSTTISNGKFHAFGCIASSALSGVIDKRAFETITTANACLSTQTDVGFYSGLSSTPSVDNACVAAFTGYGVTGGVGTGTAYITLTKSNAPSNGKMKTLHYSKEDGYTLEVVERTWHAKDIWQDNGISVFPTINMGYEGTPEPITTGNTIYKVNGYFVTAPEAETATYTWATAKATCDDAAGNGWRLPSMKDFEAMGELPPFTGASQANMAVANYDIFTKAFPASEYYWSSDATNATTSWCFKIYDTASYTSVSNNNSGAVRVRCVQKIAP